MRGVVSSGRRDAEYPEIDLASGKVGVLERQEASLYDEYSDHFGYGMYIARREH